VTKVRKWTTPGVNCSERTYVYGHAHYNVFPKVQVEDVVLRPCSDSRCITAPYK